MFQGVVPPRSLSSNKDDTALKISSTTSLVKFIPEAEQHSTTTFCGCNPGHLLTQVTRKDFSGFQCNESRQGWYNIPRYMYIGILYVYVDVYISEVYIVISRRALGQFKKKHSTYVLKFS